MKNNKYLLMVDEGIKNWNQGNLKKAKAIFLKAKKIDLNYEVTSFLGVIELQQNNFALGISNLEESYSMNPKNSLTTDNLASGYLNYGLQLIEERRIQDGQELFLKAIKIKPNFAEVYFNLGKVLYDIKDYIEALKFLNKAVEIKPDIFQSYNLIGLIYKNNNQPKKAITFLQKSLQYNPHNFDAQHNLGNCYSELKDYREAIKIYKNVIIKTRSTRWNIRWLCTPCTRWSYDKS